MATTMTVPIFSSLAVIDKTNSIYLEEGKQLGVRAGATGSVTGKLTIRYRRPTPINTDLRFEAWIDHQQGRRLTAHAHCLSNGEVTAEAEALFVRIDMKDFAN